MTARTEARARETNVAIFHNSESACVQKTAEFINAPRALLSTHRTEALRPLAAVFKPEKETWERGF